MPGSAVPMAAGGHSIATESSLSMRMSAAQGSTPYTGRPVRASIQRTPSAKSARSPRNRLTMNPRMRSR